MKKLSEVLNLTTNFATEQGDSEKARPIGLEKKDGMINIHPKQRQSDSLVNLKEPQLHLKKDSKNIRESPEAQNQLMSLLKICFDTLNNYGKEPEQLTNINKVFQMVLGRFSIECVELAFAEYLSINTNFPTPADIVRIIEPPVEKQKWSATAFIDIKRRLREGQFITDKEKKYCRDFISAQISEPNEEMAKAVSQADSETQNYYLTN